MSALNVTKVMKYEMKYVNGLKDFYTMQQCLWDIQKCVRAFKNSTIQTFSNYDFNNNREYGKNGNYIDCQKVTGYKSIDGLEYHFMKDKMKMIGSHVKITSIQIAKKDYNNHKNDMMAGKRSLDSYRENQPIPIIKKDITIGKLENKYQVILNGLLSKQYMKENGFPKEQQTLIFELLVKDNSQKKIIESVINEEYNICQSSIQYDKKKKKWFFYLTYSFNKKKLELDKDNILGVDCGVAYAAVASIYGSKERLLIGSQEADEKQKRLNALNYAFQLETIKRDKQKQASCCGEGRIGHGTKKRIESVYKARNKLSNYQDTLNHNYARKIVSYAIDNGCGTIQIEDLSNFGKNELKNKRLKHWTYFDLQNKIATKANEYGIDVVKVPPQYTSQRCSKCGHISSKNRKTQSDFVCKKCGYKENADYNASQNIAIKNIGENIKETLKNQNKMIVL